ncbi:hypothetical protein IFR05_009108 [Cadophora sp. M221]|nr:hypothetical protein IFR05_009108 [Cadophora sp. M221]
MLTVLVWKFSCGHKSYQIKDKDVGIIDMETVESFRTEIEISQRKFDPHVHPKCLDCFRVSISEKEAEEKARDALVAYQAQSDFIKKQIEAAHDNEELSANLTQTLGACQILCADQVMTLETKDAAKNEPSLSSTYTQRFTTAVDKIQLCHSGMNAKHQRFVNVLGGTARLTNVQRARERVLKEKEKRWNDILKEMK